MRRWILSLGAMLGLGLPGGLVEAKAIAPDQAPTDWVAYAVTSMQTITAWLNAETPPAPRVRAVLDATRPAPDQPTPPLVVKLWVDGQGAITRVEFAPLADAEGAADLHALLVGHRLTPPPRGLRLPLRIALQLPPPPKPEAAPGSVSVRP